MSGKTFIWDLDGTLLDSYGVIVSSIRQTLAEFDVQADPETVLREVKDGSVSAFLHQAAAERGLPYQELKDRYSSISGGRILEISAMPGAVETLEALAAQGVEHFVYTHRGSTAAPVLEHLGMGRFFREVVTSLNGFPRKPAPDALLYLMEKYGLDRSRTFYVGDRTLDMDCARNAGVRGIFYSPEGRTAGDYTVRELNRLGMRDGKFEAGQKA